MLKNPKWGEGFIRRFERERSALNLCLRFCEKPEFSVNGTS
jgi:hypothetical protein